MYRSRCLEATVAPLDLPHCSNARLTSYLSEVGRLTARELPYVAVDLTDIAKPSGKTMEGLGPGTVQAVADATVRGRGQGPGSRDRVRVRGRATSVGIRARLPSLLGGSLGP